MGELKQATAYNILVDAASVTAQNTAITIVKINKRDRVQSAETYAVAPGARQTITDTAGLRIDRIIIQFHPPGGGAPQVEVTQGSSIFRQTCNGDTDLVFEAIP
jgi:hypothetical protein